MAWSIRTWLRGRWTSWRNEYEPRAPRWLASLGIVAVFALAIPAFVTWWSSPRLDWIGLDACRAQETHFRERQRELDLDLAGSKRRANELERALDDRAHPAFPEARARLAEERIAQTAISDRLRLLYVHSLRDDVVGGTALSLVVLLFVACARRLIINLAPDVPLAPKPLTGWKWPYWLWVAALFLPALTVNVIRIFVVERSWFAFNSFCISPAQWAITQAQLFGMSLAVAYPFALLWCLSDRDLVPAKVDVQAPDGKCGVGKYVLFQQTWTILVVASFGLLTVAWVYVARDAQAEFDRTYLVPLGALLVGGALLVRRFVRNAMIVRERYLAARTRLAESWKGIIDDVKPAPDPTEDFIGATWWRIPAVIAGLLLTLWTVFGWLGVTRLITGPLP